MDIETYKSEYVKCAIDGRHLSYRQLRLVMDQYPQLTAVKEGISVKGQVINSYRFGKGSIKVLMWSQMHGNETTSTKALLDVIHMLHSHKETIGSKLQLVIIPMLNPDGADSYTRENANGVDLNRDALKRSQPESQLLHSVFDMLQPHYCFNLHDQRPIFGAGVLGKPSALSFLAPSADIHRAFAASRSQARMVLGAVAKSISSDLEGFMARFDDSFNLNCFGDYFQSKGAAAMLFEAGQHNSDYSRAEVRLYYSFALLVALNTIAISGMTENAGMYYDRLPENTPCYCDILLDEVLIKDGSKVRLGLTYKEKLDRDAVVFNAHISHINPNHALFGHRHITEPVDWAQSESQPHVGMPIKFLRTKEAIIPLNLTIF